MVNYYKILGIENYAAIPVVKEVYKQKIRLYHPDLNPSEEAAEISRWLNQAKDLLTDEEKKPAYDYQLKLAYLTEIQRLKEKKHRITPALWRRNKAKREEAEKLREKQRFEQKNKRFPIAIRLIILGLGMLVGLFLLYNNYFINFDGIEMLYSLFGVVLFIGCLFALSNLVFTVYWVKSVDQVISFDFEKWISRGLIFLFLCGPGTVMAINEYRKIYDLSHAFRYEIAELDTERRSPGAFIYHYEVDGIKYTKRKRHKDGYFILLGKHRILIKYALEDPRISQPVLEKWD